MDISLSTLDRRIASGKVETRIEPHGQRHRVYIVLDDYPAEEKTTVRSESLGRSSLAAVQEAHI